MKHWYIPLSSFFTLSILNVVSSCPRGLPSFNQEMVLIGLPLMLQVKVAGLPKSMVWLRGSISADKGAVTVSTVSTLSPPTELLTTHRYLPESSTWASRMIRVPLTWRTRSFNWTGWRRDVPSMNLYHLQYGLVLVDLTEC